MWVNGTSEMWWDMHVTLDKWHVRHLYSYLLNSYYVKRVQENERQDMAIKRLNLRDLVRISISWLRRPWPMLEWMQGPQGFWTPTPAKGRGRLRHWSTRARWRRMYKGDWRSCRAQVFQKVLKAYGNGSIIVPCWGWGLGHLCSKLCRDTALIDMHTPPHELPSGKEALGPITRQNKALDFLR